MENSFPAPAAAASNYNSFSDHHYYYSTPTPIPILRQVLELDDYYSDNTRFYSNSSLGFMELLNMQDFSPPSYNLTPFHHQPHLFNTPTPTPATPNSSSESIDQHTKETAAALLQDDDIGQQEPAEDQDVEEEEDDEEEEEEDRDRNKTATATTTTTKKQ